LNQRAGEILNRYVLGTGIKLRTKAVTREIVGNGRVRGVLLEDGGIVPAELVVIATGIRSNSQLARQAGLEVNQGVVVDNLLATSHPDIFAAGDVAEHRGQVYGIWGPSQYQGSIAGMNMAGGCVEFGGIPRSNTLKVLGLNLFSIGQINPSDSSFRIFDHEADGRYFRFVFRDERLAGAVLLGDTKLTAAVKKAVENRGDFSQLLTRCPTALEVIKALA
jgi:nitrite reductase (NADH) large subunit